MINLLSATATWYADVALAVVLVLFIILGVFKGFANSTKGFFVTVFIVFVSLLLAGLTVAPVTNSAMGTAIHDGLSSSSEGWGVVFNSEVTFNESGEYCVVLGAYTTPVNSTNFGFQGMIAKWVAEGFKVQEGDTIAGATVDMITTVCVGAIMFVVFILALVLLFYIIRKLVKPLENSTVPGMKALNRVLGALFSLIIGLVFVWIIFAIIDSLGDKAAAADEYLSNSAFAGLLYNNNPVSTLFGRIFGS